MNESPITTLTIFASIATILDFILGIYVLLIGRPGRDAAFGTHVSRSELTTGTRFAAVLLNALLVGGFWGWCLYSPTSNLSFAAILFLVLSLFWFSFVVAFRSDDEEKRNFRAGFSALVSYAVFLLGVRAHDIANTFERAE